MFSTTVYKEGPCYVQNFNNIGKLWRFLFENVKHMLYITLYMYMFKRKYRESHIAFAVPLREVSEDFPNESSSTVTSNWGSTEKHMSYLIIL